VGEGEMDSIKEFGKFTHYLQQASPIYAEIAKRQEAQLGENWRHEFVQDLYELFGEPDSGAWEDAAWGYIEFCVDASKSQNYFEKNGKYKASSFAEVQNSNYENEDFMFKNYLPGMVVSHYLWPHHYNMGKVYREKFMPRVLREVNPKTFIEGGTGSAMYTLHTLRSLPNVQALAYDISPHSVTFGRRLIERAGLVNRCEIIQRDVLSDPPDESTDFVLSQEVLEHLEDPSRFVANLYRVLRPGGMGFITGAVTAAHSDHIYLFKTPEEVFEMLTDNGFEIIETITEYADSPKAKNIVPKISGALVRKS
jgi:ubiquinone/menaquinone biosynthesis C-methylase UbiE